MTEVLSSKSYKFHDWSSTKKPTPINVMTEVIPGNLNNYHDKDPTEQLL